MNTPGDILKYVVDSGKESDFLAAIMLHKRDYSIAEIPDPVFAPENGAYRLRSQLYKLNLPVEDADIVAAASTGMYITPFLCRHGESCGVHFLVHRYPAALKANFEEDIAREVVHYMILKTIIALRLTTWRKVDEYLAQ